jgi:hypothetical protein
MAIQTMTANNVKTATMTTNVARFMPTSLDLPVVAIVLLQETAASPASRLEAGTALPDAKHFLALGQTPRSGTPE